MFEEIPKNCRYGYVRVSSKLQKENSSLESQNQELMKLKKIFESKSDLPLILSENDLFSII